MEHKVVWNRRHLAVVDRWYPSTRLCRECGALNAVTLADRVWRRGCGAEHDRDLNADELLRAVPGVCGPAAGPVVVTERDGALVRSAHGHAFELEPAGGTTFIVRSDVERLDGLELEYRAADPGAGDPLAAADRLALMGLWFAFRTEGAQ